MSEIMTEGKKAKLIDETVYNDPYVVKAIAFMKWFR